MDINLYFAKPKNMHHRQYEAMRTFLYEKKSAAEVAKKYGYTKSTIYSISRDFKKLFLANKLSDHLFSLPQVGRPEKPSATETQDKIIELRKKYLSVEEIKEKLDACNISVSETFIYKTIKTAGFAKLPKRNKASKILVQDSLKIEALKAELLIGENETFNSSNRHSAAFFWKQILFYQIKNFLSFCLNL